MTFSLSKTFDFCLFSGILFNYYCITAHLYGDSYSNYGYRKYFPNDHIVQSDMVKVTPFSDPISSKLSAYSSSSKYPYDKTPLRSEPWRYFQDQYFKGFPDYHYQSSLYSRYDPYYHHSHNNRNQHFRPLNEDYFKLPGPATNIDALVPFDERYGWYPRYQYPHAYYSSNNYVYYPPPRTIKASADLRGTNKVTGKIELEQLDNKRIKINGKIFGLSPGAHGMHILEKTLNGFDCSGGGEHFNPKNTDHGGRHDWVRHIGDLGNILADRDGIAYFHIMDELISLSGENSVVNRTIVITEGPDDLGRNGDIESKRSGNSGPPVACGVIRIDAF